MRPLLHFSVLFPLAFACSAITVACSSQPTPTSNDSATPLADTAGAERADTSTPLAETGAPLAETGTPPTDTGASDAVNPFPDLAVGVCDSGSTPNSVTATGCPGAQTFPGTVPSAVATAPLVGPVPTTTTITFDVGLPDRNQQELDAFVNGVSDPTSPYYRQYLTTDQFTADFGPTTCDYQGVIDWLQSQGFTIAQTYTDRSLIDVSGTVAQVESTFCVTMNYYLRPDNSQFYSLDRDPSVNLSIPLLGITGLDNYDVPVPASAASPTP